MLDYFERPRPNGIHLCIVMELMWQDFHSSLQGYRCDGETRISLVKEMSRQTFECLYALHGCGVIHNGIEILIFQTNALDLHLKNLISIGSPPSSVKHFSAVNLQAFIQAKKRTTTTGTRA